MACTIQIETHNKFNQKPQSQKFIGIDQQEYFNCDILILKKGSFQT